MEKINPDEPTKKLEGEQLDFFNQSVQRMSLKQLKIARTTMNGFCKTMKLKTKLFSNSKDKEKYEKKLEELKAYESQVLLFDHYIKLKKNGGTK